MFKKRRRDNSTVRHRRRGPDYLIIFCVTFLVIFGLIMLASASSNIGKERFGDTYHYLKHQIFYGLSLGLIGFFIGSKFYYRYLEKIAIPLLLFSLLLLFLVFTPLGLEAGGAERWLQIGGFSFQPSETMKIALVVYLAAWLSGHRKERMTRFRKGFLPFIAVIGLTAVLLLKQPNTSSAALLAAVALIVYFASGARLSYIISVVLIGLVGFGILIYTTPYRWERIQSFLSPEKNILDSGYHINQTLIAIGSGGLWGVGYGQSTAKINYLPEPIGDSIFAVIAEELGFIGAAALIGIFCLLIAKNFLLIGKTKDKFGQLLLVGFGSLIALQVFINIAAISGVIPLTGAPLPFISFGGTALASFMTIAGIINNIARYG